MEEVDIQKKKIDLYKKINKIGLKLSQGAYLEAAKRLEKIIETARSYNFEDIASIAENIYNSNKSILDALNLESNIEKLEIPTNKIFYDKKSMRLSFNLPYFTYIGHYKKSTKFKIILDEFYSSLGEIKIKRENIYLYDKLNKKRINESEKIKSLNLLNEAERDSKKEREKLVEVLSEKVPKSVDTSEERIADAEWRREPIGAPPKAKEKKYAHVKGKAASVKARPSAVPVPSPPISTPPRLKDPSRPRPLGGGHPQAIMKSEMIEEQEESILLRTPEEIKYDINLGFQYFATMMESKSYLFYVYFRTPSSSMIYLWDGASPNRDGHFQFILRHRGISLRNARSDGKTNNISEELHFLMEWFKT